MNGILASCCRRGGLLHSRNILHEKRENFEIFFEKSCKRYGILLLNVLSTMVDNEVFSRFSALTAGAVKERELDDTIGIEHSERSSVCKADSTDNALGMRLIPGLFVNFNTWKLLALTNVARMESSFSFVSSAPLSVIMRVCNPVNDVPGKLRGANPWQLVIVNRLRLGSDGRDPSD